MSFELGRRTALSGILGSSVCGAKSPASPKIPNSDEFCAGLYHELAHLSVPANVTRLRTAGFWREGDGQQVFSRMARSPRWLLPPRMVRTADGACWQSVDTQVTPATFGEIADGAYHALGERFPTLAAARRVYPFATSLTQSIDWAAVQMLANYAVGAEGFVPPGIRVITDPVRVPARAVLTGASCARDMLCFRADAATGAFVPGRGMFESVDYWNFANPDYWHWSALRRIAVDAAGIADHGIALWCMGEHSLLEDVWVERARTANIYIGGYGAVGTLRNCSVWHAGRYGVWLSGHPSRDYPRHAVGVVAGAGSGGSYRISNLSGDYNPMHLRADGTQIVELTGLKSEMCPVVISIAGRAIGPGRQRWTINGFRAEGGKRGEAFVRIEDGALPSIEIGPGATYNYNVLLDDCTAAAPRRIAAAQSGIASLIYGRDPGEATLIATERLGFFDAAPQPKGKLPPPLAPQATQVERDALLNAVRELLTSYGLA